MKKDQKGKKGKIQEKAPKYLSFIRGGLYIDSNSHINVDLNTQILRKRGRHQKRKKKEDQTQEHIEKGRRRYSKVLHERTMYNMRCAPR